MNTMVLSNPIEVTILSRDDLGGGVVELPLLPATEIDFSLTVGGGDKSEVTVADLEQMVTNFKTYPGPVPIGVSPHVEFGDRAGYAPGFVNTLEVRNGILYGQLSLTPSLFKQVEEGGWRGFSVETAFNMVTPTVELDGWVLTGGVFTNRPATDVNYRIAAEADNRAEITAQFSAQIKGKETVEMPDDRITALESEVATHKQTIVDLRGKNDTSKTDTTTLEARLVEVNKDLSAANISLADANAKANANENEVNRLNGELLKSDTTRKELAVKLEAEQARTLKDTVLELVKKAIDRGVTAVHFEGLEEDPVKWFKSRYVSTVAFSEFLDALPTVKDTAAVSSGSSDDNAGPKLSKEDTAKLRRLGVDPKYAYVTSENEFLELNIKE